MDKLFRSITDFKIDILFTDASRYAVGGIVYDEGQICGLFRKSLSSSERKYCTFEKEMDAVEHCLIKCGKFFCNAQVDLHCDKEAAGHFLQGGGKKITPKIQSWIEQVQQHNFNYAPTSGKANAKADYLSRLPEEVLVIKKKKTTEGTVVINTDEDNDLKRKQALKNME